jgi:hypothetical protein
VKGIEKIARTELQTHLEIIASISTNHAGTPFAAGALPVLLAGQSDWREELSITT